jgi:hypothetical protein
LEILLKSTAGGENLEGMTVGILCRTRQAWSLTENNNNKNIKLGVSALGMHVAILCITIYGYRAMDVEIDTFRA